MNQEEKLKLAGKVMQIAGIFSLVVASLLIINFVQLKKYKPLESNALNMLVAQLKNDPGNEQLREEIRDFDLMVRKAYFTTEWQVKTGTFMLLVGGILFALSLKVYTDMKHRIAPPDPDKEDFFIARKNSMRWLVVSGVLIFGLALGAAFSSNDYLSGYFSSSNVSEVLPQTDTSIQVIQIVDSGVGNEAGTGDDLAAGKLAEPNMEGDKGSVAEKTVQGEKPFGLAEFKLNHNSFRGPMGLGVSYHKNIPVSWDGSSGTNVLWKVAVSKHGYNSPVIWGKRIFIAGADAEARIVTCYDRNTGQLLWEKKADNIPGSPAVMPKVTDDTGLSAPTMACDGYRVYAIFATGDIIAFDLEGNRVWARNLGVPRNHYGHSSSLMVWDGKVIVQYDTGSGGRMLSIAGASGETVWDIRRDNNISWASPILAEIDGKMQVITNTDPNVAGYNVATGEELWKLKVMMGEVGPSCAYSDGLVFANNEYASLVAIKPGAEATVEWENYDYLSEAASPVAKDGLLYLATSYGVLVCYDAKTGTKAWEKDFGTALYSSPVIAENKVYIMDNSGVMHILKADRTGTLIAEPELGERSFAIPAFADGRIYIRGTESLYCIGE